MYDIVYNYSIMMPQSFQGDSVALCFGQWTEEVSLQVSGITQWEVKELSLWSNRRTTVVREITHINFPFLTRIHLGGNNIESIEGLFHMRMGKIKSLNLGSNRITSVGVIRKAAWPTLKELSIRDNYFGDAKSLAYGWFPEMDELSVSTPWGAGNNKLTEKCFPAKMQTTSLEGLWISANNFCFDRSLQRILQKRWPYVGIS